MMLFQLMMQMLNPSLFHMIKDQIAEKDPRRICKILVGHFVGHKQHHIENAKQILESHILNADEITLSISLRREKIQAFENAQESVTTEPYKLGLLKKMNSRIQIMNSPSYISLQYFLDPHS